MAEEDSYEIFEFKKLRILVNSLQAELTLVKSQLTKTELLCIDLHEKMRIQSAENKSLNDLHAAYAWGKASFLFNRDTGSHYAACNICFKKLFSSQIATGRCEIHGR